MAFQFSPPPLRAEGLGEVGGKGIEAADEGGTSSAPRRHRCGAHPGSRSVIGCPDRNFAASIRSDGELLISRVPSGSWQLSWTAGSMHFARRPIGAGASNWHDAAIRDPLLE